MAEPQPSTNLRSLVESAQQAISAAAAKQSFELPYEAPDRRPNPAVEVVDKARVLLLAASSVLLLATSVRYAVDSTQRTNAGLLDTSLVHGVIWPLISVALLASAGFAYLPHQLSSRRQRAVTVYTLAAAALMACAMTLGSSFLTWTSAVVGIFATSLCLWSVHELNRHTARNQLERIATDMPIGFMAGFSMVYTLQLCFAAAGWNTEDQAVQVTIVTAAVAVLAAALAHSERGRHAFASGFGIALITAAVQGWVQHSTPLWVSAIFAFLALVVFVCAENRRFQLAHAEHRTESGKQLDF